jgi:hypothetical protein
MDMAVTLCNSVICESENILRKLQETFHPPVDSRLSSRWPALQSELAERERRVLETQFGHLAKSGFEVAEPTRLGELPRRTQLLVRRATRTDEVRVIGVRESVRARACGPDNGVLVEQEHRVTRSGFREDIGDGLRSLGVRDRVAAPVEGVQRRERRQKLRPLERRRPDLEVRSAWPGERAAAEQGSAHVGGAAARPPDDTLRRTLGGLEPGAEDAGLMKHLQGAPGSRDVHLVSRRVVEGAAPVGPDLRSDTERS